MNSYHPSYDGFRIAMDLFLLVFWTAAAIIIFTIASL